MYFCGNAEVLTLLKIIGSANRKSENRKKYGLQITNPQICHTCGRSANLEKVQVCGFAIAELICRPPTFVKCTLDRRSGLIAKL